MLVEAVHFCFIGLARTFTTGKAMRQKLITQI